MVRRQSETDTIGFALRDFVAKRGAMPTAKPRVTDIDFDFDFDGSGELAVMVRVVLAKDTPETQWTNQQLVPLSRAIRDLIAELGIQLSVHVWYERESTAPKRGKRQR
jgi:hypothetical protein